MEPTSIFGLPAHPLIVHAAVVLVPVAAIGLILVALISRGRRWYAPLVLVFALGALGSVALAQGSGEALEERVNETELVEEHTEMGESVMPWAVGVAVLSAVVAAEPLIRRRRETLPAAFGIGVVVLSLISGVGATASVFRVGHSGAKAAWDGEMLPEGSGGSYDNHDSDNDDDEHGESDDD